MNRTSIAAAVRPLLRAFAGLAAALALQAGFGSHAWVHGLQMAVLAAAFLWAGRPRANRPCARHIEPGLANMLDHGERLRKQCEAQGRDLTMVVFDCNALQALRAAHGMRAYSRMVDHIVDRMTALAGDGGLVSRTGAAECTVLLPLSLDAARKDLARVLGSPVRLAVEDAGQQVVLLPEVVAGSIDEEAASVGELYRSLQQKLARMDKLGLRIAQRLHRKGELLALVIPARGEPLLASRIGPGLVGEQLATMPTPLGSH